MLTDEVLEEFAEAQALGRERISDVLGVTYSPRWAGCTGLAAAIYERRKRRVERGQCVTCGWPARGWHCEIHVRKQRRAQRAYRLRQGASAQAPTRTLEHEGLRLTVSEWAARRGMLSDTIRQRLARGWTVADALDPRRRPAGGVPYSPEKGWAA